jgi:2-phosphoglycerate kinase
MKRKTYSKYDLVKVKVFLEDHFYIFSRFLISRVLRLIKVKEKDSIRLTLEVKKSLVAENKLEISQAELEERLFLILNKSGYDQSFVKRYKMITTFYQKRLPFIIIVVGTECMGKSTLVT